MTQEIKAGQVYGRLTLTGRREKRHTSYTRTFVECKCECGNIKWIDINNLRKGQQTCGCSNKTKGLKHRKTLEKRYGTWTVLGKEYYHTMPSGRQVLMVLCRCDCGTEKYVQRSHLLNGATKNCGCLKSQRFKELAKEYSTIHGMEGTQPYKKFMSAKARCTNPKSDSYMRYGGRGIKFKRNSFEEFWEDMKDSYYEHVAKYGEENTTIERINVDGDYCKENCRWATWQEQYENMSTNHKVVYKGKEYPTIAKLCRETGAKYGLVRDRIRYGWTVEDAIDIPLLPTGYKNVKVTKLQQTPHITATPLW